MRSRVKAFRAPKCAYPLTAVRCVSRSTPSTASSCGAITASCRARNRSERVARRLKIILQDACTHTCPGGEVMKPSS